MDTFGDRVRRRREELGITQEELATRIGYKSRASINKIELNKRNMKQSQISELAKALDTTPAYLMGWTTHDDLKKSTWGDVKNNRPAVRIPVYSRVAAGIPIAMIDEIVDYEEIPAEMAKGGEYFAIKIKGDSMEPRIWDGDVVIVRKQEDAESDDIVIASVNGNDATCKRLIKYQDSIGLLSLNSKYQPMMFSKDEIIRKPVRILGKVVEVRGKLRGI